MPSTRLNQCATVAVVTIVLLSMVAVSGTVGGTPSPETTETDSPSTGIAATIQAMKTPTPAEPTDTTTQTPRTPSPTATDTSTATETATPTEAQPTDEQSERRLSAGVEELLAETVGGRGSVAAADASPPRVTVRIEADTGASAVVAEQVRRAGGEVTVQSGGTLLVRLPAPAVRDVADRDGVTFVRLPVRGDRADVGTLSSEGVGTIGADSVQSAGVTGESVTVAVIDDGFDATNPEIADHVVDTKRIGGGSFRNQSDQHGTATAEIVVDTAPSVDLVLVSTPNIYETEVKAALEYVAEETSADVVSMSLGFYSGPFDGTSEMDDLVAAGTRAGIPHVISAGNSADGNHLHTDWQDGDGDGRLNFTSDDERLRIDVRPGEDFGVWVSWDNFPASDQDYDVILRDADGNVVDRSIRRQDGSRYPEPVERVYISSATNPPYELIIEEYDADGTATLQVFGSDATDFELSTSARSIGRPATEQTAISVGAVYYRDGSLEPFSSRGPTVDGRLKPDVAAPDGVTSSVYGEAPERGFFGTSASAPHTAGVAALMLAANDSLEPATVKRTLRTTADPVLGTEPNTKVGYGTVNATAAVAAVSGVTADQGVTHVVDDDGSGDFMTIQTAVDSAAAGDTVEVRPGTYEEQLRVGKNVTLVAPDGATLDGSSFEGESSGIRVLRQGAPTISGFTMTGYGDDGFVATYSLGSWTVRNITVEDVGGSGLDADNATGDWTATNLTIRNVGEDGVDVEDSTGAWRLADVVVDGTLDDGIDVSGSSSPWTLRDAEINDTGAIGLEAHNTTGAWRASNLTVTNAGSVGVYAGRAEGDWQVSNSTVRGATFDAFLVERAVGAWQISGTTLRNNGDDGLDTSFATGAWTVRDSTLADNGGVGIEADNATGDWRVTNSMIAGNIGGVYAFNTSGSWRISESRLADNRYEGVYAVRTAEDWVLTDSHVVNNSDGGVETFNSTGSWTILNSTFVGNSGSVRVENDRVRVTGGAIGASQTSGDWLVGDSTLRYNQVGIGASRSTGNWTVRDSDIRDNMYVGVVTNASVGDWTVRDSNIVNHSNSGLFARGATGAWRVRNSTFRANGGNITYVDSDSGERAFIDADAVDAVDTEGAWSVHDVAFLGTRDSTVQALNATGAVVEGNAILNYWGASDGPSGDFSGSGESVVGNVSVEPFYVDAVLTERASFPDGTVAVDATLVSTANNVGAPIDVEAEVKNQTSTTGTNDDSQELVLVDDSGAVLDRTQCETNCTVTLSTTPDKSSWNGSSYGERTYRVVLRTDAEPVASDRVSTTVAIEGDGNGDGRVNIFDAISVGRAWQTVRGDSGYTDVADLNSDGRVNIFDAIAIGRSWQETAR